MNKPKTQPLVSSQRCLECEEAENWVYSYQESLAVLLRKAQVARSSQPESISDASAIEFHPPKINQQTLYFEDTQLDISWHGELIDISISERENEGQILLWNIDPQEAAGLMVRLATTLQKRQPDKH